MLPPSLPPSFFFSLSLTGEQGAHTLFAGQRERKRDGDTERGRERDRGRERKREGGRERVKVRKMETEKKKSEIRRVPWHLLVI
jgi:hypothetical protein